MAIDDGLTPARAARLLELKSTELDLALQLGHIDTAPGSAGGPPRVPRREVDRLRDAGGLPDELRERLRTVGTREGAGLLAISPERFTRLARAGHLTPVTFSVNRYHAVVWLYLAEELRRFARDHPALLGRAPAGRRALPRQGEDRRPRGWRARRLDLLVRAAAGPWQRAAALAAVLPPASLAGLVPDSAERAHLLLLRPAFIPVRARSAAARQVAERLLAADRPEEIHRYRMGLVRELAEARRMCPAPGPAMPAPRDDPRAAGAPGPGVVERAHTGTARPARAVGPGPGAVGSGAPPGSADPGPAGVRTRTGRRVAVRRPAGRGLLGRLRLWRPRGARAEASRERP
ncbi:DUF6397 family protein [Streptomyces sp. NPDC001889]